MGWLFLIAAIIVLFGFGALAKIIGTMVMIGIGVVAFFIMLAAFAIFY